MIERPILFSGPMIRAVLAGTKIMTRRVVKPQPPADAGDVEAHPDYPGEWFYWLNGGERSTTFHCPYGEAGVDRLWVRETHAVVYDCSPDGCECGVACCCDLSDERCEEERAPGTLANGCRHVRVIYRATEPDGISDYVVEDRFGDDRQAPWTPAIHMPRWASRILLDVVSVRVERLQDISEADAKAEGVQTRGDLYPDQPMHADEPPSAYCYRDQFRLLWDSINGRRPGCDWGSNPFVWCVSFRRAESTEARATA